MIKFLSTSNNRRQHTVILKLDILSDIRVKHKGLQLNMDCLIKLKPSCLKSTHVKDIGAVVLMQIY